MTVIYSHCCPEVLDSTGKRISGCVKGWTSSLFADKCSTCGQPSQIRGQFTAIPLEATGGH